MEDRCVAIEAKIVPCSCNEGTQYVLDEVGKVLAAAKAERQLELSFKYLGTGKGKILEG